MEVQSLKAEARQATGSAGARRVRRSGRVPAVLYGHGEDAVALSVPAEEVNRLLDAGHHLVTLDLDGRAERALVKEVQFDTWEKQVLHVDFSRVGLHETVTVSVEVIAHGTPKAVLSGAILEQPLYSIEVECAADAIPDNIRVEVSDLEVNQMIHVRDLSLPVGVKAVTDLDALVLSVHEARGAALAEAEAAPTAEAAPEPEVIGRPPKTDEESSDEEKS